ncbi:hypothetical protein ZYGR_0AD02750 [Zygosaccharomyces rouxii]|uniref:ZYRO0G12364p n=2 Tax=Zygosaccharomyces rouxii TaxID=4956 RepID=C5E0F8_ZYGRC|nr:uncharacterized protein ZYRO0G12364g [Zygosaccharomyces rouxii]KAH9202585.1 hypothetical protein LQ764DRAFT_207556 [Zygosaccharomyces rouxii]GAV51092.1 hypothetical protein ZYGR_0AD02750 [Zygosaccharomyces rouxii]CAR29592.1 ZYRO0G12364p [Zygosaccharomyces rouxii]
MFSSILNKCVKPTLFTGTRSLFGNHGVRQANQTFLSIRNENELANTLIASGKTPIILNFTVRNNAICDKLTGALDRIVMFETDKKINSVDVETDFAETMDFLVRFTVKDIPSLVAVRRGFPVDWYAPDDLRTRDVDWINLKEWIERNADDR